MSRQGAAIRLAAYYAALFAAVGVQLPFWPVWLADRGLGAAQIGVVVSLTYLIRLAVNPVVGAVVDRRGDRRLPMLVLAAGAAAAWTLFAATGGFWAILAVTALAVGLWGGIMPVGDSLAMMSAQEWRLDYGRVRLWGSAAFIATAVFGGKLLMHAPPSVLVWLIAGLLGATALVCLALPDLRAPADTDPAPTLRPLLSGAPFLLFLAFAGLNQASHTVYYAFATLHWRAAGIPGDTIGLLWSEGVLAEIVLFAISGPVVRRLGPGGLLLAAGLGGVLRWTILAATTWVPVLAAAQVLHAATFGCAHLGAMHFLQRGAPAEINARAQSVYAAVASGAAPALMSPVGGWLYQRLGGSAFLIMALVSLGAMAMAYRLKRHWGGGIIIEG